MGLFNRGHSGRANPFAAALARHRAAVAVQAVADAPAVAPASPATIAAVDDTPHKSSLFARHRARPAAHAPRRHWWSR